MAKEFENEFYDALKEQTISADERNNTDLEKRKDELVALINEMESNVIKDPKALENAKKELVKVEEKIAAKKAKEAVEKGEVTQQDAKIDEDKSTKEAEEKEKKEEIKDEQSLNDKERAEELKFAYYESIMALHNKKMYTIEKQKAEGLLVSPEEDYNQELGLEAKMYEARDAYLAESKEDPYNAKRTELIKIEKEAKEEIEQELRNKAKRFNEIEKEIEEIDKREREINEELLKDTITDGQADKLNKELSELGLRREKLEIERADVREKLAQAIETRRQRAMQRTGLEQKHIETLTQEDRLNYVYQKSKEDTMNQNFDQATKHHYDNIKRRIEEREQKIKDINKELKEIPDTDFERRLILLNELDKETHMLEADRQAKSDLDRGIVLDKQEQKQDAHEKVDNEQYRQEEFNKATDDARAVVEKQKEEIGTAVVENPNLANIEEKERDTAFKAATVAMVVDSPLPGKDTPIENVVQYNATKCVIEGLEGQVKTIDESAEGRKNAEEYLEQDKQIKEADKELDKVQANIEKRAQI